MAGRGETPPPELGKASARSAPGASQGFCQGRKRPRRASQGAESGPGWRLQNRRQVSLSGVLTIGDHHTPRWHQAGRWFCFAPPRTAPGADSSCLSFSDLVWFACMNAVVRTCLYGKLTRAAVPSPSVGLAGRDKLLLTGNEMAASVCRPWTGGTRRSHHAILNQILAQKGAGIMVWRGSPRLNRRLARSAHVAARMRT